jgi:hypothetical protein
MNVGHFPSLVLFRCTPIIVSLSHSAPQSSFRTYLPKMEGSFVPLAPSDLLFTQGDELSGCHLLPPSQIPTREISPLDLDHTDPLPTQTFPVSP